MFSLLQDVAIKTEPQDMVDLSVISGKNIYFPSEYFNLFSDGSSTVKLYLYAYFSFTLTNVFTFFFQHRKSLHIFLDRQLPNR